MSPVSLLEHRAQIIALGHDLFRITGVAFVRTTERQRQICGAFLFGFVFQHGMANGLPPADVQALVIAMLMDVLQYTAEQAGTFSSALIEATGGDASNTMKALIHRGIDGHHEMLRGEHDALRRNLLELFEILQDPYVE
ncbi:MAG TPA: Imm48 family immunity protein [Verrucomicrobiales bacterium]|nr:Imm48 family immunity protein [Verrucomicrobiales bacterium]